MTPEMYREQLLDLYQNPLNYGDLDPHTFSYEADNPLCGDIIKIAVLLNDEGKVAAVKWRGDGCAICQASASLLTEEIKGLTIDDIKAFEQETLLNLLGIKLSMIRIKCALLALKVLKLGASTPQR